MDRTPKPGPEPKHLQKVSAVRGGPNVGDWVVVATMMHYADGVHGVPVMERRELLKVDGYFMRRYTLKEEAIAVSHENSAVRVGGGWILNLRTGETVRVNAMG